MNAEELRTCTRCKKTKPIFLFKRVKQKYLNTCRECNRKREKKYRNEGNIPESL